MLPADGFRRTSARPCRFLAEHPVLNNETIGEHSTLWGAWLQRRGICLQNQSSDLVCLWTLGATLTMSRIWISSCPWGNDDNWLRNLVYTLTWGETPHSLTMNRRGLWRFIESVFVYTWGVIKGLSLIPGMLLSEPCWEGRDNNTNEGDQKLICWPHLQCLRV